MKFTVGKVTLGENSPRVFPLFSCIILPMLQTRIPPTYHRRHTILAPHSVCHRYGCRFSTRRSNKAYNISTCTTSLVTPKMIAVPKVGYTSTGNEQYYQEWHFYQGMSCTVPIFRYGVSVPCSRGICFNIFRLFGPGIESPLGGGFLTLPERPWGPPSLLYNGR